MKYSNEVFIKLPIDKVTELFDSEENLFKWQPELISFEHVSGEKGKLGAKSRLQYKMGKRDVEMIETITKMDLPKEFSATYEAKGVWNEVNNYFEVVDKNNTRWHTVSNFKFSGFMKIIAFFMPGAFKKQSQTFMDRFKEFAESA